MTMFSGLSAFPLTPLLDDAVDEGAFAGMVRRLVNAHVDSITALGSAGIYPYLSARERALVARIAVENAGDTPVFVGVGALRTSDVLAHVANAEAAGASGLLLAPMSYHPLTDTDVFELFRAVADRCDLPVIVYDNPATTHFTFTVALYGRIAELPTVASIKIPGGRIPDGAAAARAHIDAIRAALPDRVTIGVSGDEFGAAGLIAGCDAWYSSVAGTLPDPILRIAGAARAGLPGEAAAESARLARLWRLLSEFGGSLRVAAVAAAELGLVSRHCLPAPIQPLPSIDRARIVGTLRDLGLLSPSRLPNERENPLTR